MWILDRSGLNHIDSSAEEALQAEFEFEVPVEESMVAFKFDKSLYEN